MDESDIEGPPTVDQSHWVGRTIAGKFTIERFLGDGAMGAVFLARQTALDKHVALKVMHPRLTADKSFVARFQREAKATSRLDHPNSVRVIDFGEEPDGLLYLAMEYLEGRTLYDVIFQDWPLSNERIVDVLSQVLAALGVAHDMGVIHRDLKPENIMIVAGVDDEGRVIDVVKVLDFGIAKLTDRNELSDRTSPVPPLVTGTKPQLAPQPKALTTQGVVVGTPEYMSPEQARGEKLDHRSDLYSIGIILHQLLVGRVPFQAESAIGIVLKHVTETPRPLREIYAGVDPLLEAVCLKALQKDRALRFQTARELRHDLRDALEGRPSDAPTRAATPKPEIGMAETMAEGSQSRPPLAPLIQRTPSQLTPVGTEALLLVPPKRSSRSMWVGILATTGLLAGVAIAVAFGARSGIRATASEPPSPSIAVDAGLTLSRAEVPTTHRDEVRAIPSASAISLVTLAPKISPRPANVRAKLGGDVDSPSIASVVEPPPSIATTPDPPPPARVEQPAPSPPPPPPQVAIAPPPPQPRFDPQSCRANVGAASVDGSVSSKDVQVGGFSSAVDSCHRAALRANGAPWSGAGKIRVSFDDTAHFKSSTAAIASAPGALVSCIEQAARQNVTIHVHSGDITGEPQITIPVTFTCP